MDLRYAILAEIAGTAHTVLEKPMPAFTTFAVFSGSFYMKQLIAYILQFGHLGKEQIALITSLATGQTLKKGAYFSEAGRIPRHVGFVVKGVIRGFYHNNNGEDITRCFIAENSLVVDYINFEANTLSPDNLQACTHCELLTFSKQNWENLSSQVEGWEAIRNKMVQMCMYQKSRSGPVISQDATTRYLEFLEKHPSLTNRVPLAYIASYLGITQQSLSRIRKNIS